MGFLFVCGLVFGCVCLVWLCACVCVFGVSVGVCAFGVCVWLNKALPWNFPRISGGFLSDFP